MQLKIVRRATAGLLLSLSVLLSACAGTSSGSNSSGSSGGSASGPKKTVTFALASTTDQLTGIWKLAQDNGYINQELSPLHYQLKVVNFAQAGPAVNEAFVSGNIDIADYGNLPPILLKSKGFGVSIIAFSEAQLNFSLVVSANSSIKTPKDLEGKKVIVPQGTIADQYWGDLVKEYNIDTSKVQIINDASNAQSTFSSGNADAWVTVDELAQILNLTHPLNFIESTATSHPEWASQGVDAVRDQFAKEHGDVLVALMKAYIRAYNYATQHKDAALQSFASKGVPFAAVKATYGRNGTTLSHLSGAPNASNRNRLQTLSDFLYQDKLMTKKVNVSPMINDSFYKKALSAVGNTYDAVK